MGKYVVETTPEQDGLLKEYIKEFEPIAYDLQSFVTAKGAELVKEALGRLKQKKYDEALAKLKTAPASLTAVDKATLGIP